MDHKQKGMEDAEQGIYAPPEGIEARQAYEQGRGVVEERERTAAYHDSIVEAANSAVSYNGKPPQRGAVYGIFFAIVYIPVIFFSAFMRAMSGNLVALQGIGGFFLVLGLLIGGPAIFWRVRDAATGFVGWLQKVLIWLGVTLAISGVTMWLVGMH